MSDLGDKVLREIAARGLKPTPLYAVLLKRYVFWSLAGLAVLLGACTVAFGLFAATDLHNTGGKGLDEMPFDDAAVFLPVLAALAYAFFAGSASLIYRQTPRGYLTKPWIAALIAASISVTGGIVLHRAHAGEALHDWLADTIPTYRSYTEIPYAQWSQPERGRLGGTALQMLPNNHLRLRDFKGVEWIVDINGSSSTIDGTPVEEGDIAVSGKITGPNAFKAVRVDPFD
jgi:hypothetical protein